MKHAGILVAAGLILVVAGYGLFVRGKPSTRAEPAALGTPSADAESPDAVDLFDSEARGGLRKPAQTEAAEGPVPEDVPILEETPDVGLDEQAVRRALRLENNARFAEKYADYTVEQLEEAQEALLAQVQQEGQVFLEDRYAAGLYTVVADDVPEDADPADPKFMVSFPGGIYGGGRTIITSDRRTELQETHLPFAEYPHFYDLHDEWSWIVRKVHAISLAQD